MRPAISPPAAVNVVWLAEVDSTNQVAARLVAAWAEDEDERLGDTLLVAGTQNAGRGRGDHAWASPAGGLYATWLGWLGTADLAWLPLAAGVCLAAAVEDLLPGLAVGLKWPNDLVVVGRKLGGVLCHSRTRGDRSWSAVGIGVNVEGAPALGPDAHLPATSLRALGATGDAEAALWTVAGGFVRRLRPALAAAAALPAAWLARTVHRRGDALRVRDRGEVLLGTYVGLGGDGRLQLEVAGELRQVSSGELIEPLPEPGPEE